MKKVKQKNIRNLVVCKNFKTNICQCLILIALLSIFITGKTYALTGSTFVHDPSGIVKCGSRYYIFTTGGGVGVKSSADLISWTAEPSAFGSFIPAWASSYGSGFGGNYWAPHCIFMNGKYYLYYSCAFSGTNICAIGVATSPTLDPKASNYKWTDQGYVIGSTSNKQPDGIDPYAFRDTDKRVYMTYGGYVGGNAVGELDTITGKPKNGFTKIAAKGEGTALIKNGNYYYFIEQHGSCCSGVNSTYYMSCGRSTNPLGPYLDANGVSLSTSYGTDVLRKSGKYIGPGHFAHYKENGIDFVTYHYYDGDNNGSPTLGIGKLIFVDGWPKVTRNWFDNGSYSVTGSTSSKAWEANTTTGVITQNTTSASNASQKWNFVTQGNGIYTITASNGAVAEMAGCANANGVKLQLGVLANTSCQKFLIELTPNGSYVLTPTNSTRLLSVVGNATTVEGTD